MKNLNKAFEAIEKRDLKVNPNKILVANDRVRKDLKNWLKTLESNNDKKTYDMNKVGSGEEGIEKLWKKQGGINPKTGRMWLTPRMKRNAKRLQKMWNKWDKENQ